jgi:ribosomal protein S27E
MVIIKEGKMIGDNRWRRIKCPVCTCIFKFQGWEMEWEHNPKCTKGGFYKIDCPDCNSTIALKGFKNA